MSEMNAAATEQTRRDELLDAFEQDENSTGDPNDNPPAADLTPPPAAPETPSIETPPTDGTVDTPPVATPPVDPATPLVDANAPPVDPSTPPADDVPPASWSPEAREGWATIPEAARQHINKREGEIRDALNETGQARQFMGSFQSMTQPFQQMFAAQGVDPMNGIYNVLQTAQVLQSGNVSQKATALAQIIGDYGVDIRALDDMLVGRQSQQAPVDPAMAQMQATIDQQSAWMQQQHQAQQQQVQTEQQRLNVEAENFIAANEFAGDLRTVMADFFDIASRQGVTLTMDQAYQRALSTRPDIQQIIANRAATQQNGTALTAAQAASTSLPQTTGHESAPAAPNTRREALENAWQEG